MAAFELTLNHSTITMDTTKIVYVARRLIGDIEGLAIRFVSGNEIVVSQADLKPETMGLLAIEHALIELWMGPSYYEEQTDAKVRARPKSYAELLAESRAAEVGV